MTRVHGIDLSGAIPGDAVQRFAASNSRPDDLQPAPVSEPRPAERAHGTDTLALQLVFDSFREPVLAGQRGCRHGDRHLVYLSRDYAVDVRLEPCNHPIAVLRGELLSRNDGPVAEVPTFLLDGDQIAAYARTGLLGEFQLETAGTADMRLCLLLDAERCIDLPLGTEPTGAGAAAS